MMSISFLLNEATGAWSALLPDCAVKSAILLLAAWLLSLAVRRASASIRHLVWALAICGVLALPILSLLLPAWRLPIIPQAEISAASSAVISTDLPASAVGPAAPATVPFNWTLFLLAIWGGVAALFVIRVLANIARLKRFLRRTLPLVDEEMTEEFRAACAHMGVTRRIRLLESRRAAVPMVWGISSAVLVLPSAAREWSPERRRLVYLHELAHLQRGDCLLQFLAMLACAVYWFNPLAWLAASRLRRECEHACDDLLLDAGCKASEYAGHLLAIACEMPGRAAIPAAAIAMASSSKLEGRLQAILNARANRRRMTPAFIFTAAALAMLLLLPLAMLHASAEKTTPAHGDNSPRTPITEDAPTAFQDGKPGAAHGKRKPARMTTPAARPVGVPKTSTPKSAPPGASPMKKGKAISPKPIPVPNKSFGKPVVNEKGEDVLPQKAAAMDREQSAPQIIPPVVNLNSQQIGQAYNIMPILQQATP